MLARDFQSHNRSGNFVAWDYAYNLLNSCEPNSILLNDLENGEAFYFAHSYHVLCKDSMVAATIEYGNKKITAAFENKNIFGVQFHPEKSQDAGLRVLSSFLKQI